MTTCPSGVNYQHLIDHARSHVERTYRRPLADRFIRAVLAAIMPHPGRFRLALGLATLARPLASAAAGPTQSDAGPCAPPPAETDSRPARGR